MYVNSPEPTILCVITFCVWLSIHYDQDVPSLECVVFFFVVAVALIVAGNWLLGRDAWVVITLGTFICLPAGGVGVGGVSFAWFYCPIFRCPCCAHSTWESPFGKVWVGCNLSRHYHLPPSGISGRVCSVLCVTFSYFSLLSLLRS